MKFEKVKRTGAVPYAFGSSTNRFHYMGIYPEVNPQLISKNIQMNPGCKYNPNTIPCIRKKQSEPWRRQHELETYRYLGMPEKIKLIRKKDKESRGPGYYTICEDLFKQRSNAMKQITTFGDTKRFPKKISDSALGPGFHDPKPIGKKSFSKTPTFERDGFFDRFKDTYAWRVSPNRYNPTDFESIERLLDKKVSHKYGPYDTFTLVRDNSSIKNYFAPRSFKVPDKFFHRTSEIEYLLSDKSKKRYGRFCKSERFLNKPATRLEHKELSLCYRNPNDPGPADYNLSNQSCFIKPESKSKSSNKVCFNSSVKIPRPGLPWKISPGVGKYSIVTNKCNKKDENNNSWVFNSRILRTWDIDVPSID